jgi:hypothetical protein
MFIAAKVTVLLQIRVKKPLVKILTLSAELNLPTERSKMMTRVQKQKA